MMRHLILALPMLLGSLAHAGGFAYRATISADGRLLSAESVAAGHVEPLAGALDAAVKAQLQARSYALAADARAPFQTWLQGRYTLHPDGEEYRLVVDQLHGGPLIAISLPPRYPPAMLRRRDEVDVVVRLRVTPQDVLEIVAMDAGDLKPSSRRALRKELQACLRSWRVSAERSAGTPVASELPMVLQYRIGSHDSGDHDWTLPPIPQGGHVRVPAADYVPLHIQITGTRLR